jgi:hypothetical protein
MLAEAAPATLPSENTYRMPMRYAHCRSVSTLTLTTPCYERSVSRTAPTGVGYLTPMASRYSCLLEPEPPWKTKKTLAMLARTLGLIQTHQLTGLLVLATELLRDEGLVLTKQLGVEADVAGGVDAVDVTAGSSSACGRSVWDLSLLPETGRDREVLGDRAESLLATTGISMLLGAVGKKKRTSARCPQAYPGVSTSCAPADLSKLKLTECKGRHCRPGGSC